MLLSVVSCDFGVVTHLEEVYVRMRLIVGDLELNCPLDVILE